MKPRKPWTWRDSAWLVVLVAMVGAAFALAYRVGPGP